MKTSEQETAARAACVAAGHDPDEIVFSGRYDQMPGVEVVTQAGTGYISGTKRPRWHLYLRS